MTASFDSSPEDSAAAFSSHGVVRFLHGVINVEDLIAVPGTRWIIASSGLGPNVPPGAHGQFYLIDARAKTWTVLTPDVTGQPDPDYRDGPGRPDMNQLAPHGLSLRAGGDGVHTLLVVNHGGRESIEVFRVDARGPTLKLTWIGCVLLPEGAAGNAVAPLPDGGFVFGKFNTAGDPELFDKMARGDPTGGLYEWLVGAGSRLIPASEMSGANGVEVSPDGEWIFANAWAERRVIRFARTSDANPTSLTLDYMPDNMHWTEDGALLITGVVDSVENIVACMEGARVWEVSKLDPVTMKITRLIRDRTGEGFFLPSGAVQVEDTLWIGTARGDRIAYVSLKDR